jgi:hypothetical protein
MSIQVERITSHVGDVGGIPIQRALPNRSARGALQTMPAPRPCRPSGA